MADDNSDLEEKRDAKYQEILDTVAADLKLGKFDTLSDDDQERVEDKAEETIDKWTENPGSSPKSPLEKLLAEYSDINAKIPDDDDDDDDDHDDDKDDDKDGDDKKSDDDDDKSKTPARR